MLAADLDAHALARTWSVDDRLRIDGVLEARTASAVHDAVAALPFDLIFFSGGANRVATAAQLQALDAAQREALQKELHDLARSGTGFLYEGYRMEGARLAESPAVLRSLFETVNGPLLDLVRQITGIEGLVRADGQFTRYRPGHYLTRHSDAIGAEHRRVAYVLGLTRDWHPDWGGLLQFHADDGTPRDAWAPRFDSLALFDVRHVHAVSFVAPFAGRPRLSLTGWFRDA